MKTIKQFAIAIMLVSGLSIFMVSCSKTEYDYQKKPYNTIESFALAGYSSDSINAVISGEDIIIYWSAEATLPATITPTIAVSPNAKISPASGTAVPFTTATVYTVTAEDGSTKTYHLKPSLNRPIPKISAINPVTLAWISNTQVNVSGEYFLSGSASDVHVYAQRLKDGFEFDLAIDQSQLSMTNITASLPRYTTQLDTGLHKIWVKIGDRVSDTKTIDILMPIIPAVDVDGILHLTFEEAGKTLAAGDILTLKLSDDFQGDVIKWYATKFTKLVIENYTFEKENLTQTGNTIKFKLPNYPISMKPSNVVMYYTDAFGHSTYISRVLNADNWPVIPVQK